MSDRTVKRAKKKVEEATISCDLFDINRERDYPRINESEIQLGEILGKGGFCTVNEINAFYPKVSDTFLPEECTNFGLDIEKQTSNRQDVMSRCLREGEARYAMKVLSTETLSDQELAVKGIVDLALEAKFLAVLSHRNIIKLRAVSTGHSYLGNYFVVLDRLYDTLEQRLKTWKITDKKLSGFLSSKTKKGKEKKNDHEIDKLIVMFDIASALGFMHEKNVIYRDLKPENIGFDVRGDAKIFDLGLAKELTPSLKAGDGQNYKLTGWTGSPCYMAPEVALMKPYNLSADVYSYGILLWESCAYEQPYKTWKMKMIEDYVFKKGYRPKVNPKWANAWKALMKECWDQKPENRPDFDSVMMDIKEEIHKFEGNQDEELGVDKSRISRIGGGARQ